MGKKSKPESVIGRTAGIFKSNEPPLTAEELRRVAEEATVAECVQCSGISTTEGDRPRLASPDVSVMGLDVLPAVGVGDGPEGLGPAVLGERLDYRGPAVELALGPGAGLVEG